jgi:mannose-1-phosphate guanylyltransferase/phosphomannomutase
MMKAVILCGGIGHRMKPITCRIPKPLILLNNKPTIDYIMEKIPKSVNEVIVHVCYKSDLIIDYMENSDYGSKISFIIDEENGLSGTGGAIKRARKYLNEPFFVLYSDIISSIDLLELRSFHQSKEALLTVACIEVDDPTNFGNARIDSDQKVIAFKEKPKEHQVISNLASGGIFFMEPDIFQYFPEINIFSLEREVLPSLVDRKMYAYIIPGFCFDIGERNRYLEATRLLLNRDANCRTRTSSHLQKRKVESSIKIVEPVHIGLENMIDKDIRIGPNVVIGNKNTIEQGTIIRNSTVFDECKIEKNVTIENSIVDSRSIIKDYQSIENCIFSSFKPEISPNYE